MLQKKSYYVEETGYFHSTKDGGECKFVGQAIEKGYRIEEIICDSAKSRRYKMCNQCYSQKRQDSYNEILAIDDKFDKWKQSTENHLIGTVESYRPGNAWMLLRIGAKSLVDPDTLFVYFSKDSTMHIQRTDDMKYRMRLSDVTEFKRLCDHCVPENLREFIYIKVYQGYYDMSVIKDDDDL